MTSTTRPALLILSALVLVAATAPKAQVAVPPGAATKHDIRPGPGVKVKQLSDYLPGIAGTPAETPVYVLEGAQPGGTVFVAGGTHANEIAGSMAAIFLVERAEVRKGRLVVAPYVNNSAASYVDPRRGGEPTFTLVTASGTRTFRFGARLTRPEHQGAPDPARYKHPASTEEIEGVEARNLDRAYPGRADGNLTERIAGAVVALIRSEGADIGFDFHEAGPESRLAWMIVANPKNISVGAMAVLTLEDQGIRMKLEPSSETFRGLSHREWGDHTPAQAFLFETPSPAFDPKGDVVNDPKFPLARRVAVHLATFQAVLDAYSEGAKPGRAVSIAGIPGVDEMSAGGLGKYLR